MEVGMEMARMEVKDGDCCAIKVKFKRLNETNNQRTI